METRNAKLGTIAIALLSAAMTFTANAQNKMEASVGTGLVSNYVWRGMDCGGVSIQPDASVSYRGIKLEAWGSVGLDKNDAKELDFSLSYNTGGFSATITDYWFDPAENNKTGETVTHYFKYGANRTGHVFEATLGYDFGAVAVAWNTNFAGNDARKADGDRAYSTYIGISAPFSLGGLDWSAEAGLTPWEGAYSDKCNVTNISLTASKEIKITDSFALPAFAQVTFNPYEDKAYFTFGLTF